MSHAFRRLRRSTGRGALAIVLHAGWALLALLPAGAVLLSILRGLR